MLTVSPGSRLRAHRRAAAFGVAAVAIASWAAIGARVSVRAEQTAPAATSVWDGAYTLAQAKRGALKSGLCVNCHGDGFRGGPSPELAGPEFLERWDGRTVGDLFELIRLTMPDDDPGALPREQYADLLAYILAVNKFPTGDAEIGIDAAPLQQIRILATKPPGAGAFGGP
jgi:mono/diheme cytochrome c family protein